MNFRVTEVVKNLLIINILLFVGTYFFWDIDYSGNVLNRGWLGLFYPTVEYFRPYQLITHMFMHGDIYHLLVNMFMLFMFAPVLENLFGSKRFLFFYFFAGFGSIFLDFAIKYAQLHFFGDAEAIYGLSWGASGAIYGVLAGFALKFPNQPLQLLFVPIPIAAKYMIGGFIVLDLIFGISGANTGIGHFAHLGGALFGGLLILYWNKFGSRL